MPFVEEAELYDRFHLDEAWDSEHNKKLIPLIPDVYQAPRSKAEKGKTNYLGVIGMSGCFTPPDAANDSKKHPAGTKMVDITDGTSNTIFVVEAGDAKAATWTKPDDFSPNPTNPLKGLANLRRKGLAGYADGSVRFIPDTIKPKNLMRLFKRNDGEVVDDF